MALLRLAFLASHNGSNMRAVVAACRDGRLPAVPAVVVGNNFEEITVFEAVSTACTQEL